jgi:hypothetical protein
VLLGVLWATTIDWNRQHLAHLPYCGSKEHRMATCLYSDNKHTFNLNLWCLGINNISIIIKKNFKIHILK